MKAPECEGEARRNSVLRIKLPRCGSREHSNPLAQRARLSEPISQLRCRLTKSLRRINERVAKLLQRNAQKKPRSEEAELDLRARLRPIGLCHRIGRARAAVESLTFADFTPRILRMLDAELPAKMEDQDSRTVRKFTAAAKRGPALVVRLKRADVGLEGPSRLEARYAPRACL